MPYIIHKYKHTYRIYTGTYLAALRAAISLAAVRQAQRAAALVELQAQLQQLADTESESALALHALRSQVYECMRTHMVV